MLKPTSDRPVFGNLAEKMCASIELILVLAAAYFALTYRPIPMPTAPAPAVESRR
jgi:hypothetical protein